MASSTTSSSVLCWVVLVTLLLLCNSYAGGHLPRFDSIYQLGDSIADTGNLIRESPSVFCGVRPYGETLSNRPTGRCSDGLLMIDFIAKTFNLPLLNPYLEKGADFTHGVNFAVAGSTALNASNYAGTAYTNTSLPVQLRWFRSYINSTLCSSSNSSSDCKDMLKTSLFMVGEIGGNDYNYAFLKGQSISDVVAMVPNVVQAIVDAVNEVILVGAKRVVVPGNFPIGCMAVYRNNFATTNASAYDSLGCLSQLNQFASFHNEQLQQAIQELQTHHPDVAIHYADYYNGLIWLINNAASFGFEKDEVFVQCCGNVSQPCGSRKGFPLCENPKKRISWDGIHLTQEAYRHMSRWLLSRIFIQTTPGPSLAPTPSSSSLPSQSSGAHMISTGSLQAFMALFLIQWAIGLKMR